MAIDSQTYWKNRETEQRKHNIRDEAEYQKHIREIYQNMIDEIEKEINGFYGKYASKEGITMAEAKKRAAKADIEALGRKAARYVKDKDFSKQANDEMRLYNMTMKVNRLELLKAQIGLEMVAGFDELQKYYGDILTDRTISEFERQAGILGKAIQNNAKAADAIVNASFHNATYSERIWMYQDMLKNELSSLLQTGLIQGQNPRKLATHLRKRFGVSQSNAERLMITELARVQTEAQKQSFEQNGFEEYTFLALGDACPICRALDEKHFKVAKMMPGTNAPPMHPRCRCSVAAYEDSEDYEEWLDFLDNGGTTEEWNKLRTGKGDVIARENRMTSTLSIGDVDVTVSNKRYGFSNGTSKGIKKTVDASVYTTPDGTEFVFPKQYNKKHQQMTPEDAIKAWQKVPIDIRKQAQKTIEFVDYYNPQDAIWRKRYKNFSHSYATGGDKITFYRYDYPHDIDYVIKTYCHEAGHYIDIKKGISKSGFSKGQQWTKAMNDDKILNNKESCTEYGKNSNAEDFAESVAEYAIKKAEFEKEFPNRAAILKSIL